MNPFVAQLRNHTFYPVCYHHITIKVHILFQETRSLQQITACAGTAFLVFRVIEMKYYFSFFAILNRCKPVKRLKIYRIESYNEKPRTK